ncbi:MAG: hypothetical protein K2X46_04965 [Roseomonas sp.]|nr:hypothetical protein [Roseomonas sp.]
MTPSRRRLLLLTALAMPSAALAQPQPWPTRAVRIIVPFPAGAGTDTLARAYAHRLLTDTHCWKCGINRDKAGPRGMNGGFLRVSARDGMPRGGGAWF